MLPPVRLHAHSRPIPKISREPSHRAARLLGRTARTATWALTGIRPTAKGNRAVVDSSIDVFNQRDELVMNHAARRLLAGRAPG